ncbi:MAG: cytochrome c3 family protein, partial [Planctomycetota bacterium]
VDRGFAWNRRAGRLETRFYDRRMERRRFLSALMPLPARSRIAADGDLRNDHPVGARYPTGDRKFQPLSRVEQFDRIRLFDGKVECSSCHDPHDSYDQPYLLVMPNDESQLCMSCHRL